MTTSQRQRKKGLCWKLEFFSVPSQSLINLTILRIFPNGFGITCKYVWSVLLSLKFQANTYSFERVVTLFVGYYFSSGHRVDAIVMQSIVYAKTVRINDFRGRKMNNRRQSCERGRVMHAS